MDVMIMIFRQRSKFPSADAPKVCRESSSAVSAPLSGRKRIRIGYFSRRR